VPSMRLTAERTAFGSALPLTFELAMACAPALDTDVGVAPREWAFMDRLLTVLSPHLAKDVHAYYDGSGPHLDDLYPPDEIDGLDRVMLRKLVTLLEERHPEVVARIGV
jgi:hypothetical protein